MIARRTLLAGAPAAVVATTLPAIAAPEHPWEKARRLARELSNVLDECSGGRWYAEIYPASSGPYACGFGDIDARRASAAMKQADPFAGLCGLPLAAEYGRLAAQAMAHPDIMGRWEMSIVSGDAEQQIGFQQIGPDSMSRQGIASTAPKVCSSGPQATAGRSFASPMMRRASSN